MAEVFNKAGNIFGQESCENVFGFIIMGQNKLSK